MTTIYAQDVSHLYTTYDLGADPQHADPLPLNSGHAIAYYAQDEDGDAEYVCTKWSDGPIVEDYVIELIPERATCV